mgnify:CR=1 FL=1
MKKLNLFKNVDSIIFDFDDTIVNEEYWIKSRWKKTFQFCENDLNLKNFGSLFWKVYHEKGPQDKKHVDEVINILGESKSLVKKIVLNFLAQKTNEKLIKKVDDFINIIKSEFKLGIITNGNKDIQLERIKNTGLNYCFNSIICSESIKKPSEKIFFESLKDLKVKAKNSIYIGNDYNTDCITPMKIGMKVVHLSPCYYKCADNKYFSVSNYNDLIKIYYENYKK